MTAHDRNKDDNAMLVLGTGELGMSILRHLAPRCAMARIPLSALVSPRSLDHPTPQQAQCHDELRAMGVTLLPFDLVAGTNDDLVALLRGVDTVVGCTGFVAGAGTQIRITEAVLGAGVRRYIPWQFGVDYDVVGKGSGQPVFDEQFDVRSMLRVQQATEWIIVSTGMFTSFLFEPAFGLVALESGIVRGLGSWETRVTVTTPDDIGRCTSTILFEQPRIANQVVYLASDTVSYGELADIVDEVTGRRNERELLTHERLRADLAAQPQDAMARYRIAFARGDGMWWDKAKTYNARHGIPTVDVRAWLRSRC